MGLRVKPAMTGESDRHFLPYITIIDKIVGRGDFIVPFFYGIIITDISQINDWKIKKR